MDLTTDSRANKAKQFFLQGYNCSQAVAMAFSDLIHIDEKTVARLVSGFGGGFGRLREVCGAFSGITFVMSALYGYDNGKDFESKKNLYAEIQTLAEKCKKGNGSIICKELLGLEPNSSISAVPEKRNNAYYKKRPCAEIVETCAKILEDYINNKQ